jgi:hypothetical protein
MRSIAASYVVLPFITIILWGSLVFTEGDADINPNASKTAVH